MQYEVVILLYRIETSIPGLHCSSLVECMERVPWWPWTNRKYLFVAIATCAIDLTRNCYCGSMQYEDGCNFTSFMRHILLSEYAARNVDNGLALIFVG